MISFDEVKRHASRQDCWMVIHGQVYNLTSFLDEHPGGARVLLKEAGKDATAAYDKIHSKDIIASFLPKGLHLGPVDPSTLPQTESQQQTVIQRPPLAAVLNVFDMEAVAKQVLSKEAWAYYSSGADDELTLQENHAAFHRIWLKPRVMINVRHIDLTTKLLGTQVALPIYITATALGKLGHPEGEVVLTRAGGRKQVIQMMPTLASCSLDEMMDAALSTQTQWFQLYVNQNRSLTEKLVKHAEKRGAKALCITVDAPSLGKREKDMRTKFVNDAPDIHHDKHNLDRSQGAARAISTFIDPSLCWEDLAWFKSITKMPIILKGIQCAEDALLAVQYGCQGIIISNHGGRQLDTVRSGIEILPEVIQALEKANCRSQIQVYVDGGFRRGSDIFKALALGADAVGLGRPFLYGMSAYGQAGVEKVIDILTEELTMAMRMMGVVSIPQLQRHGPQRVLTRSLNHHPGYSPRDYLSETVYEKMHPLKSHL